MPVHSLADPNHRNTIDYHEICEHSGVFHDAETYIISFRQSPSPERRALPQIFIPSSQQIGMELQRHLASRFATSWAYPAISCQLSKWFGLPFRIREILVEIWSRASC